jgi:hypothetical protein
MMLRELIMNAIEASSKDKSGKGIVTVRSIFTPECPNIPKLSIINNGYGLSGKELADACDLSSSIGKPVGLDGNFGIGAKVACLPSNKKGMRYRSCKNGIISQVVLHQNEDTGEYGVYEHEFENGYKCIALNVTKIAESEGYNTVEDWTEVVLYGNEDEQNTVVDPYNNKDEKEVKQWIQRGLYQRFFKIPENVSITLEKSTNTRGHHLNFKTLHERFRIGKNESVNVESHEGLKDCKHESVTTEDGVTIHYIHDPLVTEPGGKKRNASYSGAPCNVDTFISLAYKGEFYEYTSKDAYRHVAPKFGIPWGYKVLTVIIELPDNYNIIPDSYREHIRYRKSKEIVKALDFSTHVLVNRPKWFLDVVENENPSGSSNDDIQKELQELLDDSILRSNTPSLNKKGEKLAQDGEHGAGGEGRRHLNDDPNPNPKPSNKKGLKWDLSGAINASMDENKIRAPKVVPLFDDASIEEKEIAEKAAIFDDTENVLYVNMKYSAVSQAYQHIVDKYATYPDQDMVAEYAMKHAGDLVQRLVGRAVIYAKVKKLYPKTWSATDIERALSPECLSLAADNWIITIQSYYSSMSKLFKISLEAA